MPFENEEENYTEERLHKMSLESLMELYDEISHSGVMTEGKVIVISRLVSIIEEKRKKLDEEELKKVMKGKTHYHRSRVISGHAPHKLVKMENKQYTDRKKDERMAIQILIKAPANNLSTKWEYEVQYFKEHGNTKNDIWNRDAGYIQQTSLYQLYLKATLEAIYYLNTLTKDLRPDTHKVTIHMPCEICIGWLQDDKPRMLSPRDRTKTKRGYRQFVAAINVETKEWKVEYKLSKVIEQ